MRFFFLYLILNVGMQVLEGTSEIHRQIKNRLFFCGIIKNFFQNGSIEINIWNLLIFAIPFSSL